jgi:hypothetical protein
MDDADGLDFDSIFSADLFQGEGSDTSPRLDMDSPPVPKEPKVPKTEPTDDDDFPEAMPKSKRKRAANGGGGDDPDDRLQRSRERNKIHAKRSRMRKKFFLQGLKSEVERLREQRASLLSAVQANVPAEAAKQILERACKDDGAFEGQGPLVGEEGGGGGGGGGSMGGGSSGSSEITTQLQSSDFTLVRNLLVRAVAYSTDIDFTLVRNLLERTCSVI